jgi:predicted ATP-grasp superfamily ATP-dependent carboligase
MAVDEVGLRDADLRIDDRDGSVRMIELNPRLWGSVHYSHFVGANFPELAVRRALGESVTELDPPVGRCRSYGLPIAQAAQAMLLRIRSKLWRLRHGGLRR